MKSKTRVVSGAASAALVAGIVGHIAAPVASGATWPVYDLNMGNRGAANREMFQGYFDSSANSAFATDLHEGIDILADGQGGQEVAAVRAGVLIENSNSAGGTVAVRVNVGTVANPVYETDTYAHVDADAALPALGGAIAEGVKLGNIGTGFDAGSRHLHYDVASGAVTTNGGVVAGTINTVAGSPTLQLNPYLRFTAAGDRDPFQQLPALTDTNGDNKKVLIVAQGNTNPAAGGFAVKTKAVFGNLDIIADMYDKQNSTLKTGAGPMKMGYNIRALFDQMAEPGQLTWNHVKSDGTPYVLANFNDSWAATAPASTVIYADSGTDVAPGPGAPAQVISELRVKPNPTIFPESKHYIVTNTKGSDGTPAKAAADQFWRTNAKDDGSSHLADTANGVGMAVAAVNAEARFKDGDYELRFYMSDAAGSTHDVFESAGKVRLDNFVQTSVPGANNGVPFAGNAITTAMNASNVAFLPGHELDAESPEMTGIFNLGDTITAAGDEYYPNLTLPTFVFPDQATWVDGAAFPAAIASGLALSDDNGLIAPTNLWVANMVGTFNLIIDYDRDGKFSSTLDGLSAFQIVPEPAGATILLAAVALGTLARRRRPN